MRILRGLIAAFSHFSILPVPHSDEPPDAYAIAWLPLVGLVIGAISGWAGYAIHNIVNNVFLGWSAAIVMSIALSGAIHVDGFLDCCDALFASTTAERRLEILKDVHHGSFAVVGMSLLTIMWLAALSGGYWDRLPWVLPFAAMLSRSVGVCVAGCFPHARSGVKMPWLALVSVAWLAAVLAFAFYRHIPLMLTVLAFPFALLLAWFASRRLNGGVTGDVYGFVIVVSEVSVLIGCSTPRILP